MKESKYKSHTLCVSDVVRKAVYLSLVMVFCTSLSLTATFSPQEKNQESAPSFVFPDKAWERWQGPAAAGYPVQGSDESVCSLYGRRDVRVSQWP